MKRKQKRNYRGERNAARDFANNVMDGHRLPTPDWTHMWGVIYTERLRQIRRDVGKPGE
jgi:hypothetical protein